MRGFVNTEKRRMLDKLSVSEVKRDGRLKIEKGSRLGLWTEDLWLSVNSDNLSRFLQLSSQL